MKAERGRRVDLILGRQPHMIEDQGTFTEAVALVVITAISVEDQVITQPIREKEGFEWLPFQGHGLRRIIAVITLTLTWSITAITGEIETTIIITTDTPAAAQAEFAGFRTEGVEVLQ